MSLSQLRPLSFGETLDGAFTLYRRHFTAFVVTGLLAYAPVIAVALVDAAGLLSPQASMLLDRVTGLLAAILAFGALTRLASDAYLGEEVSVGAAFRAAGSRFRPVWASLTLQGLAVGLGLLLLVVPGVIAFIVLFAMVPVVVLEGKNSSDAQGRSRELARGAWKRVLGTIGTFTLITWVPVLGTAIAVAMIATAVAPGASEGVTGGVVAVTIYLVRAAALPVQVIGAVLLYYDRRVRTEALDLALPTAAEAPVPAFA